MNEIKFPCLPTTLFCLFWKVFIKITMLSDRPNTLGVEQLSPLLITAAIQRLITAKHYAYVCSSGPFGYHAFKEMLQNGVRGSILLLESQDLGTLTTTANMASHTTTALTVTPHPTVTSDINLIDDNSSSCSGSKVSSQYCGMCPK